MNRILLGLLLLNLCATSAFASVFDIQVGLLREKADLCLESIKVQKCGTTEFCQDHDTYKNHIFKSSAETWVSYHIKNNNVHQGNSDAVIGALKASNAAAAQAVEAPKCAP